MSSQDPAAVTPQFKQFIEGLLLYRCRIKQSTYDKIFDTQESWKVLRQAFVHKSLAMLNYELLEFEGDVVLNLVVVEYIRTKFPDIVSVKWNTRIKHNLISKKILAEIAVKHGFFENIAYSGELCDRIERYEDPTDCREYLDMNEDTVEALCGAITRIFNKHTKVKGVGYNACYNLISSMLDEIDIPITYKEVFDAKSRMKELFDAKGWNSSRDCNIGRCLQVFDLVTGTGKKSYTQPPGGFFRDVDPRPAALAAFRRGSVMKNDPPMATAFVAYKKALRGKQPDDEILNTSDRFLVLGFACVRGDQDSKTLLAVTTGNKIAETEQAAAEIVIEKLARRGIWLPEPDPYKTS